jgi:hypothetical protein
MVAPGSSRASAATVVPPEAAEWVALAQMAIRPALVDFAGAVWAVMAATLVPRGPAAQGRRRVATAELVTVGTAEPVVRASGPNRMCRTARRAAQVELAVMRRPARPAMVATVVLAAPVIPTRRAVAPSAVTVVTAVPVVRRRRAQPVTAARAVMPVTAATAQPDPFPVVPVATRAMAVTEEPVVLRVSRPLEPMAAVAAAVTPEAAV